MPKSKHFVVDSSVIIKWLNHIDEDYIQQAQRLLDHIEAGDVIAIIPDLVKYEVGNALLVKKGLNLTQANVSLGTVYNLPLTFVPMTQNLAELTYKTGQELNITFYDASFVSIAEQLGAVLVTDNVKHQGKSTKVKVIPLKDY